jgi:hypothetical protein
MARSSAATVSIFFTVLPESYFANNPTATKELHGLSPLANCTDLATAACRLCSCQLLRIEGCRVISVTVPYGRSLSFLDWSHYFFFQIVL